MTYDWKILSHLLNPLTNSRITPIRIFYKEFIFPSKQKYKDFIILSGIF